MKTFKTKSGLELPLLDLKGKDYLVVAMRILWWRTENPLGRIDTECVQNEQDFVVYKATISIPNDKGDYIKLSDGFKREDYKHFVDAHEKAATGAIGRALALCGYGTQFAPELDEEERIVDSPVTRPKISSAWSSEQKKEYCIKRWNVSKSQDLTPEQIIALSKAQSQNYTAAMEELAKAGIK